jgi:alpha-L-fucosidase
MLIDIVSKNGARLFKVPQKVDGRVPVNTREPMLEPGKWLKINGDAIYGTRPWKKHGEGSHTVKVDRLKKGICTTRRLFVLRPKATASSRLCRACRKTPTPLHPLHRTRRPFPTVSLPGIEGALEFTQDENGLPIPVPASAPSEQADTFKFDGLPWM